MPTNLNAIAFSQYAAFSLIFFATLFVSARMAFDITKNEGRRSDDGGNSGLFYTVFLLQTAVGCGLLYLNPTPLAISGLGGFIAAMGIGIMIVRTFIDFWKSPAFFYVIALLLAAGGVGLVWFMH